jgi:hypothetical protein
MKAEWTMGHGRRLKRAPPTRARKARFAIYCEGARTEPRYFRDLEALYGNAAIIDSAPVPRDPLKLAEEAIRRAGRLGPRGSLEENDQVWAVFDRDEHASFDEAIRLCERNGVRIGRSNPCFELWLILHARDFDKPDSSREVCRHLQTLNPGYDPDRRKVCSWDRFAERVLAAERRARLQLARREREGGAHGSPSTTVGMLTVAIRMASESASGDRNA